MVDDVVGTCHRACRGIVRIAGGRDDRCPGMVGPLNGVIADPAGPTHDQQRLAFDGVVGEYGAVRRHSRNAEACPDVESRLFRQARRAAAVDRDILRRRPEPAFVLRLEDPDTLSLAALVDTFADRFDDTSAVAVGNYETVVQQVRERTGTLLDV